MAKDQAADDLLMGLLEQLLKQPQRGNADLGQEGVSRMALPAPTSRCAWDSLTQIRTSKGGCPLPSRFWGVQMCVDLEMGSLAGPSSITNWMSDSSKAIGFSVPQFPCLINRIWASSASQSG